MIKSLVQVHVANEGGEPLLNDQFITKATLCSCARSGSPSFSSASTRIVKSKNYETSGPVHGDDCGRLFFSLKLFSGAKYF